MHSSIKELIASFSQVKVMVIGDVMVDKYTYGTVDRISPEAPIPIVKISHQENRLGGAANVALNIKSLGASPYLISVVGKDEAAMILSSELIANGLNADGLIFDDDRMTTVKHRVIAGTHQMIRLDEEQDDPIPDNLQDQLLGAALSKLTDCQVVVFQDYDKGCITKKIIDQIIEESGKRSIPVLADPKRRNFYNYRGVSLFKPNARELADGFGVDSVDILLEESSADILSKLGAAALMVTLSEKGVHYIDKNQNFRIPAHVRQIADVSGAGDTMIAVAALGLAVGLRPKLIAQLSNLAGGIVCESPGVIPIDKKRFIQEADAMMD